jgi:hypothetical protein
VNTSRTLEQLEATKWPEPPPEATALVQRCHALRKVPLERLTASDLRILIGQDVGLRFLIPIALEALRAQPMLEAEYYSGDLLASAMRVERRYWASAPAERDQLIQVARSAQSAIEQEPDPHVHRQVAKDIATFLTRSAA